MSCGVLDAVSSKEWLERRALLAQQDKGWVEAKGTPGKGEGIFAKAGETAQAAGRVVLTESAVATARDLPLPDVEKYCAHCGGDVAAGDSSAAQCGACSATFCGEACVASAGKTWHHSGTLGLCSAELVGILHKLSASLREAYVQALFAAGEQPAAAAAAGAAEGVDAEAEEEEEEEEGEMGAAELLVVQQVFTDCILSLKLCSVLHRRGALPAALDTWTTGLSEEQRERGTAILANFVANVGECVEGIDEEQLARAYDVCVTNSWPGDNARHIFAAHSLINHSCEPNAKCTMLPRAVVQIAATSAVAAGEELSIDYTDGRPPASLTPDERETLESQWGHPCLCPVCLKSKAQ